MPFAATSAFRSASAVVRVRALKDLCQSMALKSDDRKCPNLDVCGSSSLSDALVPVGCWLVSVAALIVVISETQIFHYE